MSAPTAMKTIPLSATRQEIAAAQSRTDYSRVERVDRVESVAILDAKRPYSTLMF